MFSKRDLGIMVTTIIVITVAVMIGRSMRANNEETLTTVEIVTEARRTSEIASESVTEARKATTQRQTEAPTERITEAKKTEHKKEIELEIVEISETAIAMEIVADTQSGVNEFEGVTLQYSEPYYITDNHLTRSNGLIRYNGHRETWYSTNEKAGQETARDIPGKHVADDGTIRDKDGYVCVASSDLAFYTKVMTSVGPGKVYDCGCSHGTIDVYTNW
jgi:hypothetical protein